MTDQEILDIIDEEIATTEAVNRDIDMITGCGKILALLNPEADSGGTFYTVGKAKELGINVENFWRN